MLCVGTLDPVSVPFPVPVPVPFVVLLIGMGSDVFFVFMVGGELSMIGVDGVAPSDEDRTQESGGGDSWD